MKQRSKRFRLILSALFTLTAGCVSAQTALSAPRLIVSITVDNLRTDYLEILQRLFGAKGFNRLLAEGTYYDNLTFGYLPADHLSGIATLMTGNYPFYHGILADKRYNRTMQREELTLSHPDMLGNYSSLALSPRNLLVSTVSDELKIATENRSLIYAISPSAQRAIVMAGHAGTTAFWLDDLTGQWATSTYYRDFPLCVSSLNDRLSPARVDTMAWEPFRLLNAYLSPAGQESPAPFRYPLSRTNGNKMVAMKSTPYINQEITDLAKVLIKNTFIGKRSIPDLLAINYSLDNWLYRPTTLLSLETQDAYLRLDAEIGALIETLDKQVGLQHVLIVLSSSGYVSRESAVPDTYKMPMGTFYPHRATALLNMYLMAIYGDGNWVLGYSGGEVFLNRKLISDKLIDEDKITNDAAQLLQQMTGVQDAVSLYNVLRLGGDASVEALRNGVHRRLSGDVLIEIESGWKIAYEDHNRRDEYRSNLAVAFPLVFWRKEATPLRISSPVRAVEVSPTLSQILRIRPPNSAKSLPLINNLW